MQVTETSATGLKRELKVVIGRSELNERFTTRLGETKDQVQLKGFRKGKVPVAHVKKLFGRSIMAEVLQQTVEETSRKAISDRNERPAHQPKIDLSEDKQEIERVLTGEGDLAFTMSYEALPPMQITDLSALKLEQEVASVTDEAREKAIADLVERAVRFEVEADRAAGDGDRMTIDFLGRVDGQEFEGGKGEDMQLVIGQSNFIQGFVEGLKGAKAGEQRAVNAKFPEVYPEKTLAGKDAVFDVTVKEVAKPIRPEINDEFAKTLGAETLAKLRELVTARIASEYVAVSRQKLKRQILDQLDKAHDFALPESLVSNEFESIWGQLKQSREAAGKSLSGEGKSEEGKAEEGKAEEGKSEDGKGEDELRADYRRIAERRVRLGLLIGEIGDKAKLQVSQDDLRGALIQQARRYPGQERFVYDYYEKNPAALVELRAPIFEDKVINHILELSKPTEKKVTVEELFKPIDGMEPDPLGHPAAHAHHHDHDHHHHHHDHDHDHHDHGHEHPPHQHGEEKR